MIDNIKVGIYFFVEILMKNKFVFFLFWLVYYFCIFGVSLRCISVFLVLCFFYKFFIVVFWGLVFGVFFGDIDLFFIGLFEFIGVFFLVFFYMFFLVGSFFLEWVFEVLGI